MTTAKLVRTALTPISKIWEIYFICQEWISCKHCLILRLSLLKVLLNIMPLVFSSRPPPLCGCIQAEPNYIAQQGDHVSWQRVSHYFKSIPASLISLNPKFFLMFQVAARVRTPDGEEQLILAEIVSFNPSSNKYPLAIYKIMLEKYFASFSIVYLLVPYYLLVNCDEQKKRYMRTTYGQILVVVNDRYSSFTTMSS